MTGIAILRTSMATATSVPVGPSAHVSGTWAVIPSFLLHHGEAFAVQAENGHFFVVHPSWSLVGAGRTLQEAATDLEMEIVHLRHAMADDQDGDLTAEARRMRDFVFRAK